MSLEFKRRNTRRLRGAGKTGCEPSVSLKSLHDLPPTQMLDLWGTKRDACMPLLCTTVPGPLDPR